MPIKVLLADDSRIVRQAIRRLLSAQTEIEIEVVGEADDFAQTIQMTSELKPEIIVMDLRMPDEGIFSPEEMKSHLNHGSQLLAISFWDDEDSKMLAESFGAAVLLDKTNLGTKLVPTIIKLAQKRMSAGAVDYRSSVG